MAITTEIHYNYQCDVCLKQVHSVDYPAPIRCFICERIMCPNCAEDFKWAGQNFAWHPDLQKRLGANITIPQYPQGKIRAANPFIPNAKSICSDCFAALPIVEQDKILARYQPIKKFKLVKKIWIALLVLLFILFVGLSTNGIEIPGGLLAAFLLFLFLSMPAIFIIPTIVSKKFHFYLIPFYNLFINSRPPPVPRPENIPVKPATTPASPSFQPASPLSPASQSQQQTLPSTTGGASCPHCGFKFTPGWHFDICPSCKKPV